MASFRVLKSASYRIDEIYIYTLERWGEDQANLYINGLFQRFQAIADHEIPWQKIPAEFGIAGFYTSYEKHHIYWKELSNADVGVFSVLHQNMDKGNWLKEDV